MQCFQLCMGSLIIMQKTKDVATKEYLKVKVDVLVNSALLLLPV